MELEKKYKYKFSIVMAIYNVEKYLEEAILSVINQDIGFEESVQLILVNDGSPDNSHIICEKYKKLYPNNIVYIEKENGGVSSARNEGMKYIEGKYMNFLDSDDKFNENTLSKVYDFFEERYNYIDVVSIPTLFFEGRKGEHILNYKYKKTRQINILKEYANIQLFANSAFIKSEFKDKFNFRLNMKYAEDAEFINKILMERNVMGVVSDTNYWYRFRDNNSSAIQTGMDRSEWYNEYLKTFSLGLINYCKNKVGYVPQYIQYTIMYDLQWRFKIEKLDFKILNKEQQEEFIENLVEILKNINDIIIIQQKNISFAHKKYILSLKYGYDIETQIDKIYSKDNVEFMFKELYLASIHSEQLKIDILEVRDNKVILEGCISKTINNEDYQIEIELNDKVYITQLEERRLYNKKSLSYVISKTYGFNIEIKLDEQIKEQFLKVYLRINETRIRLNITYGKFVRLNRDIDSSYFITNTHRVLFKYNSFIFLKNSLKTNIGRELRLLYELCRKKDFKALMMRIAYFITKAIKRNEIWIFMDRIDKADDNAEHLFKYAVKQDDRIKKYFVIGKEFDDYSRVKKFGKVIGYNSIYHKFLLLLADKVISSQGEDGIRVPFRGSGKHVRELCDYKFIFLQHGITKDNLSGWLNKYNKNIDMFVTAVNKEYESILEEDYGYDESVVKLTGFPRYDGLNEEQKEKIILIMPTWRNNIVFDLNQTTGIRPYNDKFKESNYFKRYNSLINNKKLLDYAIKYGYKIIFFPHPCIQQQIEDFNINDQISIPNYNESYQKMFNKSSLLITDYSSVAFDFAYINKPVLYYQFDKDDFFKGHTYSEGYFNYETMGMGPIYMDEEKLVDGIINYIENECNMMDFYKERVSLFFKYTDRNNCKRVYDNIKLIHKI